MEEQAFNWVSIVVALLATQGTAAWIAAFLTNKRGDNRFLDMFLDFVELIAMNINKAKNDPNV